MNWGWSCTARTTESVAADENVPVVQEEDVGDASEPPQRFAVAQADGFGTEVARGHDQGRGLPI